MDINRIRELQPQLVKLRAARSVVEYAQTQIDKQQDIMIEAGQDTELILSFSDASDELDNLIDDLNAAIELVEAAIEEAKQPQEEDTK